MEKKQTALDWYIEQLDKLEYEYENKGIGILKYIDRSKEIRNQAKQMEKEQIEMAYKEGNHSEMRGGKVIFEKMEQYYNETYGGNNE
jgi:hypothetical protein